MGMAFFQDHNGNNSSTRLIAGAWVVGVLVAWMFLVFTNKSMPDLPQTILTLLGGAATWLTANKHIEVTANAKADKPAETNP